MPEALGDRNAQLAPAYALVALVGSTTALVLGGRYETVRQGLAALSAIACALAYTILVAPQCVARPDALGVAILVVIILGGSIAAVSCYGRYTGFWEAMKASVRSYGRYTGFWEAMKASVRSCVGAQPLPDLERGEA